MSEEATEHRKKLIYQARLSEHCERYDDMVEAMKQVVLKYSPLSVEERNLMSVGYKNVVGQRRSALRTFKYMNENSPDPLLEDYIQKIEEELNEKCNEIVTQVRAVVLRFITLIFNQHPLDPVA